MWLFNTLTSDQCGSVGWGYYIIIQMTRSVSVWDRWGWFDNPAAPTLVRRKAAERCSLSVTGGVLVVCYPIRYPDKAIREKQILQPHRFNSLVPHRDELLKNGVLLKLVLYESFQTCLLSGSSPPVFIALLINLLFGGCRGRRAGWTEAACQVSRLNLRFQEKTQVHFMSNQYH